MFKELFEKVQFKTLKSEKDLIKIGYKKDHVDQMHKGSITLDPYTVFHLGQKVEIGKDSEGLAIIDKTGYWHDIPEEIIKGK